MSGVDTQLAGLVGINDGRVANSYVIGNISGQRKVGGLIGYSDLSAMIVRCYFIGNVTGTELLGGLVGWNDAEIIASHSAGTVFGMPGEHDQDQDIGGLVGFNYIFGSITSSFSTARVRGKFEAGGLVGVNGGSITYSYATGDVIGSNDVGGLTAWNTGTILASYATGDVSGERKVGGLCGGNSDGGVIATSYAVGTVTGSLGYDNRIGGLAGYNEREGKIIDSYWNTENGRAQRGLGRGVGSGARGATTVQMQRPTGYTGIYSGWNVDIDNTDGDFDPSTGRDDVWDFGSSGQYPALRVDFDGDGTASWQEFGDQRGQ